MRVFPDANFLVAAGLRPGGDYRMVLDTSQDRYVTSEHVLLEVSRNLERLGVDSDAYVRRLRQFMELTDRIDMLPVSLPLEGAGDRQALAEAVGAACDVFITTDKDFNSLFGNRVKGVLVEKSSTYVRRALGFTTDS